MRAQHVLTEFGDSVQIYSKPGTIILHCAVPDAERRLVSIAELKAAPITEDAIADAVEAARASMPTDKPRS